jgi:hypothetical protein
VAGGRDSGRNALGNVDADAELAGTRSGPQHASGDLALRRIADDIPASLARQLTIRPGLRGLHDTLSPEQAALLYRAFEAFRHRVLLRTGQGWHYKHDGEGGNRGVSSENAARGEEADHALNSTPYQALEEQVRVLPAQIAALQAKVDAGTASHVEVNMLRDDRARLSTAQRRLGQSFGRCGDWAEEIGYMLNSLGLPGAVVDQQTRGLVSPSMPIVGPSFTHTAASLAFDGKVFVFDPWATGTAEVFALDEWKRG